MPGHPLRVKLGLACMALGAGRAMAGAGTLGAVVAVSQDERSIFETVIDSWLGPGKVKQLVDRRLSAAPSPSENADCAKGLRFGPEDGGSAATSLDGVRFDRPGLTLVDGESWSPDDQALTDSVHRGQFNPSDLDRAFAHSLFTLSRVRFTSDHQDALVSFSHVCGRLCGSGSTLRLHKAGGRWRIAERCGGWIS
jgi:hypothetical protein